MAALAFLPASDIEAAWLTLKDTIPEEGIQVVNYFDENYVRSKFIEYCEVRKTGLLLFFHLHYDLYVTGWNLVFQGHRIKSKHGIDGWGY